MSETNPTLSECIDLAATAQIAGDYETALRYLRAARIMAFTRPASMQKGNDVVTYSLKDIDDMIADLTRAMGANSGIQIVNTTFSGELES